MRGDPQVQQLVGAQPQGVEDAGVDVLEWPAREAREDVVQPAAAPQRPEHDLVDETPVPGVEALYCAARRERPPA